MNYTSDSHYKEKYYQSAHLLTHQLVMDPTCGLIGKELIPEVINFDVELGLGKGALLLRFDEAA
jgi:hypothetical protein